MFLARIFTLMLGALALSLAPATAQVPLGIKTTYTLITLTENGTFTTVLPAKARLAFEVQCRGGNQYNCFIHFGSDVATQQNSIRLYGNDEYSRTTGVIPNQAVQIALSAVYGNTTQTATILIAEGTL